MKADARVPSCLTGMVGIDWEIIAPGRFDQIVKYATALRLGSAVDHPVGWRLLEG